MTPAKVDPATLELRARPRPVTRLNRTTVAVIAAALAGAVAGLTVWSLQETSRRSREAPTELHNVDRISQADSLARLPADYTKVPAPRPADTPPILGPPLPGDLGGPLLRAEQSAAGGLPSPIGVSRSDPTLDASRAERIARQREAEDAAKAALFFRGTIASGPAREDGRPSSTTGAEGVPAAALAPDASKAASSPSEDRDAKQRFLDRPVDMQILSQHALQAAASPYLISAGNVIPAALITGINSDLPGLVLATVTQAVYDSATGHHLLIPQGSRLIGQYDSQIAFGQRRVLMVWNRLILPDAASITLDRQPGMDTGGYAGLEDQVDWHWGQLLAGAALSTLIGVAAELAAPDRTNGQNEIVVASRQSLQESINQVGQELTRRRLDVAPTLTIRPGYQLRVIVNRDLVMRPYQPLFFE